MIFSKKHFYNINKETPTQKLRKLINGGEKDNNFFNRFMYLKDEDKKYYTEKGRVIPEIRIEIDNTKTGYNNVKLTATTINNDKLSIKSSSKVCMEFNFGVTAYDNSPHFKSGEHILYLNNLTRIEGPSCGVAKLLMIYLYNLKKELSFSKILLHPEASQTPAGDGMDNEQLKAFYINYLHIEESSFVQSQVEYTLEETSYKNT